jgi:hypothetical protein
MTPHECQANGLTTKLPILCSPTSKISMLMYNSLMKKAETKLKTYGHLKDGTLLTDASAKEIVDMAFDVLKSGNGRIIKSPSHKKLIKTSVTKLPVELQQAAQYK